MTGTLVLVRHGESKGNVWPHAYESDLMNFLTLKGVKQVELAAIDLARENLQFDTVISSALTRARHTTSILLQALNDWQRKITIAPELNEWFAGGEYIGEPGQVGEARSQHIDRVHDYFETTVLPKIIDGETILLVAHFYTIEAILWLFGLNLGKGVLSNTWTIPNAVPIVLTIDDNRIDVKLLDQYHPVQQH